MAMLGSEAVSLIIPKAILLQALNASSDLMAPVILTNRATGLVERSFSQLLFTV